MRDLISELRAGITEAIFNHRWVLLEGYHLLGKEIIKNGLEDKIEQVASGVGQMPKTIWYCIQLAKLYPDLNSLPDGKNVSWYKITKTLPPYEKSKQKPPGKSKG